jgi:hypothetical protein
MTEREELAKTIKDTLGLLNLRKGQLDSLRSMIDVAYRRYTMLE